MFQACFISKKFTGCPGPASCNPGRDQDYLACALIDKARGDRIVLYGVTARSLRPDLPGSRPRVLRVSNPVDSIRAHWPFEVKSKGPGSIQRPYIVQRPNQYHGTLP